MKSDTTQIFRADAARRYRESHEKAVLPRLVSPPVFICLWMVLGLLIIGGGLLWFVQVPEYISCPAVVVDWRNRFPPVGGDTAVVAFLPLESSSRVKSGQKLFVQFEGAGRGLSQSINFVDPQIISPDAAHKQFALNASAALTITQPAAVAVARLQMIPDGASAAAYVGSVHQVEIEVGARRLVALLPLIGQLLTEEGL